MSKAPEKPKTKSVSAKRSEMSNLDTMDGVFSVSTDRKITYWGGRAEQLTGYSSREAVGRGCYERLCLVECNIGACERLCAPVENSIRKRPTRSFDVMWKRKNKSIGRFNVTILFSKGGGKDAETVHIFRDVSETRALDYTSGNDYSDGVNNRNPLLMKSHLTRREDQALKLLASGLQTKEIASLMGLQTVTARNYIISLKDKLGAGSRVEAVVIAIKSGLI
ncbi:MAG: LuxR C-terminal-related transcriptional regulator [SAR202 cluster bacterium]|nr:LuxR C-terminal-related transcriptional regulator [SAR202 cluster bacterium]